MSSRTVSIVITSLLHILGPLLETLTLAFWGMCRFSDPLDTPLILHLFWVGHLLLYWECGKQLQHWSKFSTEVNIVLSRYNIEMDTVLSRYGTEMDKVLRWIQYWAGTVLRWIQYWGGYNTEVDIVLSRYSTEMDTVLSKYSMEMIQYWGGYSTE